MPSFQSAAAVRAVATICAACTSTIPGQARGELEALNSIGSPQVVTGSRWDDLRLITTVPASVVLTITLF